MTRRQELIQNVQVALYDYKRLGGYRRAIHFWAEALALVIFAEGVAVR